MNVVLVLGFRVWGLGLIRLMKAWGLVRMKRASVPLGVEFRVYVPGSSHKTCRLVRFVHDLSGRQEQGIRHCGDADAVEADGPYWGLL